MESNYTVVPGAWQVIIQLYRGMASNYTVVPRAPPPVFETGYFGIFQPAFAYILYCVLYCMYSTSVGVIIGNYLTFNKLHFFHVTICKTYILYFTV